MGEEREREKIFWILDDIADSSGILVFKRAKSSQSLLVRRIALQGTFELWATHVFVPHELKCVSEHLLLQSSKWCVEPRAKAAKLAATFNWKGQSPKLSCIRSRDVVSKLASLGMEKDQNLGTWLNSSTEFEVTLWPATHDRNILGGFEFAPFNASTQQKTNEKP